MSKPSPLTRSVAVAVVAAICVFTAAVSVVLGQKEITATAPATSKAAAVVAATEEVLKETSEVRQLTILKPVKSGAQSRAEIEKYVRNNLDSENSPARVHAAQAELQKMGLVDRKFDLHDFLVKVLTEQVAGYYDAKSGEFFLADWIDLEGQKPVMSHELTHALQDQHFNLRRFEHWPAGESDSELATHALVEGDATLTMTFYMVRNPARALEFLKSLATMGTASSEQIDKAPRALRESLLFPYQEGMQWVSQLQKQKGWAGVSAAFEQLPASTEQVMHVDKYLSKEAPIRITQPDIHKTLGDGWKRIDYDVNGEWGYYLILSQFLPTDSEARRAAAGWGGDRYSVYEDKAGSILVAQNTVWDSDDDAREFFEGYALRTKIRYPELRNSVPVSAEAGEASWDTDEGTVYIQRRNNRVIIIEGLKDKSKLKRVSSAIWSSSERSDRLKL